MNIAHQSMNFRKTSRPYGGRFDVERKKIRLKEISEIEALEGFWNDTDNASKIQKEKSILEDIVEKCTYVRTLSDDFEVLCEMADEGDEASLAEAVELYPKLESALGELEKKALLSGEYDVNNAIVTINAGAGGTESCDWASMLYRMIVRWCEDHKFKVQTTDVQHGDSAGIKSATIMVSGNFAYGQLKSEIGVHRLVRISPFDSNARRHTSFASVFVSPEVDDSINIDIQDKDLRIDVYRSSGAGGQSVNTTDSAVRITHLPTGISVACQIERSQLQNKMTAMKILRARLFDLEMEKRRKEQQALEDSKMDIAWGSQIRSYVLHPYKLVKDHRTGFSSSQAESVLDGEIDDFMKSYLQWMSLGGKKIANNDLDDL